MTQEQIRQAIKWAFQEERIAMHQEWDAVNAKNHQDAAACHARRRQALNRVGALMEQLS